MKYIIVLIVLFCISFSALAENKPYTSEAWDPRSDYMITRAIQGKIFYIKGNKYRAKGICGSFEKGQWVRFVDRNPNQCFDNTIYNRMNGELCEVFCVDQR